jgi:hypothetical protein
MKILFVNQEKGQCGVYQFGYNTAFILNKFTDIHVFEYWETENEPHVSVIRESDFIILNHHPSTMGWVSNDFFSKYADKKFAVLMHDTRIEYPNVAILHPDPTFQNSGLDFKVGRPILNIKPSLNKFEVPTIGSFGFGFDHKGFDEVVNRVNEEFENAKIRIHIPLNSKVDSSGYYAYSMRKKLEKIKIKDGISLEITHDYKTEQELVNWLSDNSINVFLYRGTSKLSSGCSSTIDWAIASETPFAVSSDPMFRHVPSNLCLDNGHSLKSIMENGLDKVRELKYTWSERSLYENYCGVIDENLCT